MTTKRDKKDEPKAKRPKLKRETLRDLTPNRQAEDVRGGLARPRDGGCSGQESGCAGL